MKIWNFLTTIEPFLSIQDSPPTYQLSAPHLRGHDKLELRGMLEDVYADNAGDPIVYLWAEKVKEFMQSRTIEKEEEEVNHVTEVERKDEGSVSSVECPVILTGDCIEDRKSVFQGHCAEVSSVDEVKAVIAKLYENRLVQVGGCFGVIWTNCWA